MRKLEQDDRQQAGARHAFAGMRALRGLGYFAAFGTMAVLMLGASPVLAQETANKSVRAGKPSGAPFAGFGSTSREPVKIDAQRLEVFDKENRAVYAGDVVSVQGQTIMRCSVMNIYYATQGRDKKGAQPTAAPAGAGQNAIKKIECEGPVSLLSGTQSATSQRLVYDAEKDIVTLTGKVVIADCDNVQRGERAVYDVKTGKATVDAGANGRVQGVFTPGGEDKKKSADSRDCAPAKAQAAP